MSNHTSTVTFDLPPLPSYTLAPARPLIPWLADEYLALLVPIACYWTFSLVFHIIDTKDYFPQYRIHTPAEILKRNRVSKKEVIRSVLTQQVFQCIIGVLLSGEPDLYGREDHDVAIWARRIRIAQGIVPVLLSFIGIDARRLGKGMSGSHPIAAGILTGGQYPYLKQTISPGPGMLQEISAPSYVPWEIFLAKIIYWAVIPVFQIVAAVMVAETWQYFTHRLFHENQWLYRKL